MCLIRKFNLQCFLMIAHHHQDQIIGHHHLLSDFLRAMFVEAQALFLHDFDRKIGGAYALGRPGACRIDAPFIRQA